MRLPRNNRMGKICDAGFHAVIILVMLCFLVWLLPRGIAFAAAFVLLLLESSQPWWILAITSVSLLAGSSYVLKTARIWLRPDQDFVN